MQLTTIAPEGNGYLAVWPEFDGVMPDDVRTQTSIEGHESDGTLTELSLAIASAPGTFFDVSALHVLTTATLQHLGSLAPEHRFAVERYRPNIVIDAGIAPFAENDWTGAALHFGGDIASVGAPPDDALHHDDARAG